MGNCCSSSTTAALSQDDKLQQLQNSKSTNGSLPTVAVQREGAERLLDFGYEYRLHEPCSQHEQETANAASTKTLSICCTLCSHRLFRIQDNALVTPSNRKELIPPKIYDQVARLAQQVVISWLQRDYQLQMLPLFTTIKDKEAVTVHALVSPPPTAAPPESTPHATNHIGRTLLIINGRGVARAGILSTRHTIESGIEKGSAVVHISQAMQQRSAPSSEQQSPSSSTPEQQPLENTNTEMAVVCLDSNALGSTQGLDTVCRSLPSPALAPYVSHGRDLYVLCHSAAGGNFVQYLLKTEMAINNPDATSTNDNNDESPTRLFTVEQIKALVFTDSTHDLQWLSLKNNTKMAQFLQSNVCLYIRNNREHASDTFGPNHSVKKAGEPFDCRISSGKETRSSEQWKRRFGTIQTVYAGTMDHSLMCYTARDVIWDFFNSKLQSEKI